MHIDAKINCATAFTMAMDPYGRQHVVFVIKRTFDFPEAEGVICRPAAEQDALVMSDTFWGEPGVSAPREETDFSHIKPRCDVLLEAMAHTPEGRPRERVRVGVRLGAWSKVLDVVGDRMWLAGAITPRSTDILPFVRMPITYDRAFGGVDRLDPDDDPPHAYLPNPVGRGWHRVVNQSRLTGSPLPNIEKPGQPISLPWESYVPMSFGPVARGWPDRLRYAGTYDQNWIDNVFPFLPRDFDIRHYQAAPEDQQIAYPTGGEPVTLVNLTPEGRTSFRLPDVDMPVVFVRRRADDVEMRAPVDTVVIRPEERKLTLTWRASLPLERDIFEVPECIVGHRSKAFWRARRLGKTYYPSLRTLVGASETAESSE